MTELQPGDETEIKDDPKIGNEPPDDPEGTEITTTTKVTTHDAPDVAPVHDED